VPCEPIYARFEAILAPDESWMIFDLITGMPAEIDGQALIGLDRQAAAELAQEANHACQSTRPTPKRRK
jgi:hypothetical protein